VVCSGKSYLLQALSRLGVALLIAEF